MQVVQRGTAGNSESNHPEEAKPGAREADFTSPQGLPTCDQSQRLKACARMEDEVGKSLGAAKNSLEGP